VGDVAVSPHGDRIAWLVERGDHGAALWISKLDGTDMRLLGSEAGDSKIPLPRTIRWSPSGQMLSYEAGDSLWIVPVK